MELYIDEVDSEIGPIALMVKDGALCALEFEEFRQRLLRSLEVRYGRVLLRQQEDPGGYSSRMRAYLDGELEALSDIPVETKGTPFQEQVWQALREIPPGRTVSYGELAASIGEPRAVRAVGLANSRNPVGIVIPCHRVIGADGSLTGYAGGMERKRWLLAHEGVTLPGKKAQGRT